MDEEVDQVDEPGQSLDRYSLRGGVLIHVAEQIDKTKNKEARDLLIAYMDRLIKTIKVPPQGELSSIEGGKAKQVK